MNVKITSREDPRQAGFDHPSLILVEGIDDRSVAAGLIEHEGLEGFQVHDMVGKDKWGVRIKALVRDPSFESNVKTLGLVRDADDNPARAWTSSLNALNTAGLSLPREPIVIAAGNPSIAVMIVPSHEDKGAIEELCMRSFDPNRIRCVGRYMECVNESREVATKAFVQAYLAGLNPLCRDLGIAAKKGTLDFSHEAFNGLRRFVRNLRDAAVG